MKISLLSVAPPYRGGISEQSYYLYKKLKDNHSVNIINFKRQYPNFLFPGKTQYENSSYEKDNQNYRVIDSINPFSWIRAAKLLKDSSPDLIILRFWNPFFSICHAFILKRVKKYLRNIKVICICDNINPHEKHFYDKFLIAKLFKYVDGFIVMSEKVEEELLEILQNPTYRKLFHPVSTEVTIYPKKESKIKLGLSDKNIILFFGLVRSYKGLDVLIKANKYLKEKMSNYQILVCGESYENEDYYTELIKDNSSTGEIKWINEFIPYDKISTYFSASDVVVLPYKSASQSGVIPLAYSYQIPVIASDIKGISEMVLDGRTGLLFEQNDSVLLAEKISQFFNKKRDYGNDIKEFRENFSWNSFIDEIESLYKCLK